MTITEGIYIAIIGAIVSVIASLASTALQGWKWRTGEQPVSAASAADSITDTSLSLVIAVRKELEDVREELKAVRKDNKEMREKLEDFDDLKDWAERLVHQVQSLGGTPVKMRSQKISM